MLSARRGPSADTLLQDPSLHLSSALRSVSSGPFVPMMPLCSGNRTSTQDTARGPWCRGMTRGAGGWEFGQEALGAVFGRGERRPGQLPAFLKTKLQSWFAFQSTPQRTSPGGWHPKSRSEKGIAKDVRMPSCQGPGDGNRRASLWSGHQCWSFQARMEPFLCLHGASWMGGVDVLSEFAQSEALPFRQQGQRRIPFHDLKQRLANVFFFCCGFFQ